MLIDNHIHAVAHGEYHYNYDWLRCFAQKAKTRGINEIGFSEHDEYLERVNPKLLDDLGREYRHMKFRLGLEIDYIPGRQSFIRNLITNYPFDYVLGSVHFIEGWGFDHPDYMFRFEELDIDKVYADYFELVKEAVLSGLFDVISHLDLIKVWGHRPRKQDVLYYVEPVLQCIKQAGQVIEINSGGLRKPVAEFYPAAAIVKRMAELGIPITLGSDAHHPDQVGYKLYLAARMARQAGYSHIVKFDKRQRELVPL